MKLSVTLLFIAIISVSAYSQNSTMWFINGKKIQITDYKLIEDEYSYPVISFTKADGKTKKTDASEVFSVTSPKGEESILYKKDLEYGNEFEVDEMKNFLSGKTYAHNTYKANYTFIGGILAGAAGGLLPALGTESATVPIGVVIPVSYIIVASNTTKTFDQIQKDNPDININEHYLMGVQKGIQEKRMKKSVLGVSIGLSLGIATYFIFQN